MIHGWSKRLNISKHYADCTEYKDFGTAMVQRWANIENSMAVGWRTVVWTLWQARLFVLSAVVSRRWRPALCFNKYVGVTAGFYNRFYGRKSGKGVGLRNFEVNDIIVL